MRQLGRAIGIVAAQAAREAALHADVAAFHAPSECHDLVSKGEARRARLAFRHAKAVSGLSRSAFRTVLRQNSRALRIATDRAYARVCPWGL